MNYVDFLLRTIRGNGLHYEQCTENKADCTCGPPPKRIQLLLPQSDVPDSKIKSFCSSFMLQVQMEREFCCAPRGGQRHRPQQTTQN